MPLTLRESRMRQVSAVRQKNNLWGRHRRLGVCLLLTGFLVLLMMILIFSFSAQDATRSSGLSGGICGQIVRAVQKLFGDTGTHIIGTRHGEKLYETLMTREERLRSEDMGNYYRVAADNRDLNYDKYVVKGQVHTMAGESYTSHNTNRLDVEGTVKKILTTDYVKEALANWEAGK